MDFKSSSSETSTKVLTSLDYFAEYKLSYPHLFTDLTDVAEAFTNGTDLILPSPSPDLYEVLMPAQPAVLDAAGNQVHPLELLSTDTRSLQAGISPQTLVENM